jgi:nicotinate-nucleotide adenylyltransferase
VNPGPVGILGGTFNPIHYGHLRSAVELRDHLGLAQIRLMPAAVPPLRDKPCCTALQRAEMVRLAVADEPGLLCDERELQREGPSYTIDSLQEIRAELGMDASLILILGTDAVSRLDNWHRWQELLEYAHLVVIARPGWELPQTGVVGAWLQRHLTAAAATLQHRPCGGVFLETLRPLAISATEIRQLIAVGRSPRYLLPDTVWKLIQSAGLYGCGGQHRE